MNPDHVVRIGLLGAARAALNGIIEPAKRTPGVRLEAVASRSVAKANSFARAYSIPKVHSSYEALLEDQSIDAVYVALPTALHYYWTLRALEHHKHVLCEKPLALDAAQARHMLSAARNHKLVLQEGMHVLFLPILRRQRELATSGVVGRMRRLVSVFRHPNIPMAVDDFRLDFAMGGGAALDLGCYAVACMLDVAREEPEVVTSQAECVRPGVDRWMRSTVKFPSGATGVIECGFQGNYSPAFGLTVECEKGTISWSPRGLAYTKNGATIKEDVDPVVTYEAQLRAFEKQVRGESSDAPQPERAIATAQVLDAMYQRAGLAQRVAQTAA